VREEFEGKGVAFSVYASAEAAAARGGAYLLQCTIRDGNEGSERFFLRQGFRKVGAFYYERTGNNVGIWQKVLRSARDTAPPDRID
jgi:hypothetical protein